GTYTLLSQSPVVNISTGLPDYANSSIYQAPSGAWVFAAGTISWGWALSRSGYADARIQQTTTNILNRFLGLGGDLPNPPTGFNAITVSTSQINLSWTDNSTNETNFVVERSLSSMFSSVTSVTLPGDQTTLSGTGLAAGTTYYYRVKAINQSGASLYSNISSATTTALNTPNAPSGLAAATVSTVQVNITCNY